MPEEQERKTSGHSESSKRLIALTDWPKFHPWPPVGGLRHLAFHAEAKGCSHVFKRVGRRVLIDEKAFFQFIDDQDKKVS